MSGCFAQLASFLNPVLSPQVNMAHHSLQFVCKLLMAAITAAALLPGLVYSKAPPGATSSLLLLQVHTHLYIYRITTEVHAAPCAGAQLLTHC